MSNPKTFTLAPDEFLYSAKKSLAAHDPDSKLVRKLGQSRIEKQLAACRDELAHLQDLIYAERRHKILIVLQGLDTSGKDGTIKHVFRAVNPQGVKVASFKRPAELEASHDFLWRIHRHAPSSGEMVIFNRSHYEDVVVPMVHRTLPKSRIRERLHDIRRFEEMLIGEGTVLFKFFLNISRDEQARRIEERLRDPEKHWKFSMSDLTERDYWKDYQRAYDEALAETDRPQRSWYVVPGNHKRLRDLIISSVLIRELAKLNPRPPRMEPELLKKIAREVKTRLHSS